MRKGMSLFLAAVTMAATVAGAGVCEVHADGKELRFLDVSPSETRRSIMRKLLLNLKKKPESPFLTKVFPGMMQQTRSQYLALPDSFRML